MVSFVDQDQISIRMGVEVFEMGNDTENRDRSIGSDSKYHAFGFSRLVSL